MPNSARIYWDGKRAEFEAHEQVEPQRSAEDRALFHLMSYLVFLEIESEHEAREAFVDLLYVHRRKSNGWAQVPPHIPPTR